MYSSNHPVSKLNVPVLVSPHRVSTSSGRWIFLSILWSKSNPFC
jgi:muramidase (phage lysozyme)